MSFSFKLQINVKEVTIYSSSPIQGQKKYTYNNEKEYTY